MGEPTKSASEAPELFSRRQAIMGALALAAGTLVAARPKAARAANGDPVTAGGAVYTTGTNFFYLTTNGFPSGGEQWSYAMINRNGTIGEPVQSFGGIILPDAPAGSSAIWGDAYGTSHYGVVATHSTAGGIALKVEGKAQFSRSGKATISKGHASRTVTGLNNITADSIILVTLQGSAGKGNHVRWAKRLSSTSFQVVLTKAAAVNVAFGWMILN
jgi:hypothetical protein